MIFLAPTYFLSMFFFPIPFIFSLPSFYNTILPLLSYLPYSFSFFTRHLQDTFFLFFIHIQRLVIPVPLEVLEMLNMFKTLPDHGSDSRNFSSPLLQMLLPHFEEIFDEIEVETVNSNTSKKTDFKSEYLDNSIEKEMHSENHGNGRRIRYCIQGVVTVSEGESSSTLDRSLESRTVAAIIIEWKSSPTGNFQFN